MEVFLQDYQHFDVPSSEDPLTTSEDVTNFDTYPASLRNRLPPEPLAFFDQYHLNSQV